MQLEILAFVSFHSSGRKEAAYRTNNDEIDAVSAGNTSSTARRRAGEPEPRGGERGALVGSRSGRDDSAPPWMNIYAACDRWHFSFCFIFISLTTISIFEEPRRWRETKVSASCAENLMAEADVAASCGRAESATGLADSETSGRGASSSSIAP